MINWFVFYRFIAPFRVKLQNRLRAERMNVDSNVFARELGLSEHNLAIGRALWEVLRAAAFVPDFRPGADDSLSKVYAMGAEEVRDDVIEPLLDQLRINVEAADFTGFDFASIATPRDVASFAVTVADVPYRSTNDDSRA